MTSKEAIGRIQEHRRIHSKKEPFTPYLDEAFDMAIEALKERPHGEWVQTYYSIDGVGASRFKCSKCENEISKYGKPYNFCPNCGADMRGVKRNDG